MTLNNRLVQALLLLAATMHTQFGQSAELQLQKVVSKASHLMLPSLPNQLPMSRSATGKNDIKTAWLAKATARYQHGVLGDKLEAAQLSVITNTGETLSVELEEQRVFEDLQPRIVDLDSDGKDEIIVVESDANAGAALAIYAIKDNLLQLITATDFLGRRNRWLNPAGVGDFDADGKLDIALVATPHIGGILRLYHYSSNGLSMFAERRGMSTHSIGSTELGLAAVVRGARDMLLLPDQDQTSLLLIEWNDGDWIDHARVQLPSMIVSSLVPVAPGGWEFSASDGRSYRVLLK